MTRPFSWLIPVMALLLAWSLLLPAGALAQDATPIVGACDAPELPPGTPTPMEEMATPGAEGEQAMATPEGEQDMEMATPEGDAAEAMATPELPAGEPADDATSQRVIAAIAGAIECYNSGDYLGLAASFSPNGLVTEFGISNPYDIEAAVAGGPPLEIISLSDVQIHADGRYSADLVYSFGGTQISRERWFVVESGDDLHVDETSEVAVDVPEGALTIEAGMVDYAFELSQDTVPANQPLVFQVTNLGEYPHELLIIQLPEGATIDQVMDNTLPFEEIGFMGATFSEGGQPAPDLVLTGLEAGTYTIVCFVDVPEGIPHVARGMIAELTVE